MKVMQSKLSESTINPIYTETGFNTSTSYKVAKSTDVINFFADKGFIHEDTSFSKVKKAEKNGYQKHVMIFSRPDLTLDNDNILRILVTNSHDKSTSLVINVGIYRSICANGLVVGNSYFTYKIPHVGKNFYVNLNEKLIEVITAVSALKEKLEKLKTRVLSGHEINELNSRLVETRLGVPLIRINNSFDAKREGDTNNDAYTVFNRAQEVILDGSVNVLYFDKNKNTNVVRNLRRLKSPISRIKLNYDLWDTMETFLGEIA